MESEPKMLMVREEEVFEIYQLLEKLNHFFHQPLHYEDVSMVDEFVHRNYKDISRAYYHIVWNWLPVEMQKEITGEE